MKYEAFRNGRIEHLIQYKKMDLKINDSGKWMGREYEHILPKSIGKYNLLSPFAEDFYWEKLRDTHKHHLNSSQSLAFNYFFPFIENNMGVDENKLSSIFNAKIGSSINIKSIELEKYSHIEDVIENKSLVGNTTFDVFFYCEGGEKVSIEVKYSENGFGRAKNDEKHQQKFVDCYQKYINEKHLDQYFSSEYLKMEKFLKHYQLMRNLIHLGEEDWTVVFLFPKNNEIVRREAELIPAIIKDEKLLSRVHIIFWEDLLETTIDMFLQKTNMKSYYNKLNEKYFLDEIKLGDKKIMVNFNSLDLEEEFRKSTYKSFSGLINSEIWEACVEAVNENKFMKVAIAENDNGKPPVLTFLEEKAEKIQTILLNPLTTHQKRQLGAFWGFVFIDLLGYQDKFSYRFDEEEQLFDIKSASTFLK